MGVSVRPMLHHQSDADAFLRRRSYRGAVFMEPGLGKTRVGLKAARGARRTLVLAPLNPALYVWPEQAQEWEPDMSWALVRGSPRERSRILFDQKPELAILNYDLLHWFYDEVRERRKLPYELLILDESNAVKNSDSVAFRALDAVEEAFDGVIPMTGTPAENSLHDLWGQLAWVGGREALGKRIGVFRERYCSSVRRENYVRWVVNPNGARHLRHDAAPLCFVRRAEDCIDMPALSFVDVPFELSRREREFYDKIKTRRVVALDEPFVCANTGVAFDKMRQVASGFVYDEERVSHQVGESKVDRLEECVDEERGRPMLVGFWFQGSKRLIRERLGDVPAIDRFTSLEDKARYLDDWKRGRIPVLLGQIATMAKGLNMQSPDASVMIYDLPWSHGLHWQFIRRIWRQGQRTRVVVRRLIARGTVERHVARVLQKKQNEEDELMNTILELESI